MAKYNVFQIFDLSTIKQDHVFVSGSIILNGIGEKTFQIFKLSQTDFVFVFNDEVQFILNSYGTWFFKGDFACRKTNDFTIEIGFKK